jgi:hypothetical protein
MVKISSELGEKIASIIYQAQWYWAATGIQTEHVSDLSLEEHYIENEDEVINDIVQEVLRWYKEEK